MSISSPLQQFKKHQQDRVVSHIELCERLSSVLLDEGYSESAADRWANDHLLEFVLDIVGDVATEAEIELGVGLNNFEALAESGVNYDEDSLVSVLLLTRDREFLAA